MSLKNSRTRYGGLTKFFHWLVFVGFVFQYFVATIMLNIAQSESLWGFTQGFLYNWHKSVGLILFGVILCRYLWRRWSKLPDWAPGLSAGEKRYIHWVERLLYFCMFAMPISGYIFVMAGGYGVHFFGIYHLPNPIGKIEWLALLAEYIHYFTAIAIALAWLAHMALVIKRQFVHGDRYVQRMWPFVE